MRLMPWDYYREGKTQEWDGDGRYAGGHWAMADCAW